MSVAKSYARALFEAAQDQRLNSQALDELELELRQFVKVIESSKELEIALFSPLTTSKEKLSLLDHLIKAARFSTLFGNFLLLLARKDRLGLLSEVSVSFSEARLIAEGGVSGELIAADPMDQKDVDSLSQAFSQKLGRKVNFQVSVDSNLLAGMKVTVNGVTYDGTLRSQLQRLRDRFVLGFSQG